MIQIYDDAITDLESQGRDLVKEPVIFCPDPRVHFGIFIQEGISSFCVLRKSIPDSFVDSVWT